MSYQVVNTITGEIAVMFPEDDQQYEPMAIEACNRYAEETPGYWAVLHITEVHKVDTRKKESE
jgi:hypothetical protein